MNKILHVAGKALGAALMVGVVFAILGKIPMVQDLPVIKVFKW